MFVFNYNHLMLYVAKQNQVLQKYFQFVKHFQHEKSINLKLKFEIHLKLNVLQ
jgi:hypothetical protein